MNRRVATLLAILALGSTMDAAAQGGPAPGEPDQQHLELPRLFIVTSVGIDAGNQTSRYAVTFPLFAETGRIDTTIGHHRASRFDAGFGVRLWRRVGAGASVGFSSSGGRVDSDIALPYPFLFDRTTTRSTSSTSRQSTRELLIEGQYLLRDSAGWQIMLSGGPAITWLRQELSSDRFDIRYAFPFEEIIVLVRQGGGETTGRGAGGHAGVSVVRRLGRRAGIDGRLRWARLSTELEDRDRQRVSIVTGGLDLAVGLRLIF